MQQKNEGSETKMLHLDEPVLNEPEFLKIWIRLATIKLLITQEAPLS